MEDQKLYDELLHSWRHYVSWREKIFAGYLTVLAALGVAFSQNASPGARVAVFAGAILLSVVFKILDLRNQQYVNACQDAASTFENKPGCCTALTSVRRNDRMATFSLGIMLLTVGVISASVSGMYIELVEWRRLGFSKKHAATIGLLTFVLVPTLFRLLDQDFGDLPKWVQKMARSLGWKH